MLVKVAPCVFSWNCKSLKWNETLTRYQRFVEIFCRYKMQSAFLMMYPVWCCVFMSRSYTHIQVQTSEGWINTGCTPSSVSKPTKVSLHQDALMLENMPGNQGIPHTKGQYCRKCVHVMASSCHNEQTTSPQFFTDPVSKVQGANMGPIWGRQDPGGPHVGPINFVIWVEILHDLSAKGTNHMWHWVFFLWIFTLVCIYFFHCILTIEYLGW